MVYFKKGRVLARDAVVSKNTNELKTRTPPMSSLVRGDAVRRLMVLALFAVGDVYVSLCKKKELTLHLACGEGRERYFGCNLMQRKVLASSHQHLMAEAPA